MLDQRLEQFEQEKKQWEMHKKAAAAEGKAFEDAEPTMDAERERAWQVMDLLGLIPNTRPSFSTRPPLGRGARVE